MKTFIGVLIGLTISNFLTQFITDGSYIVAVERSWFQLGAIITYICVIFLREKFE